MENTANFEVKNFFKKLLFNLSIVTFCGIFANLFLIYFVIATDQYYNSSSSAPKFWMVADSALIFIVGSFCFKYMRLNVDYVINFLKGGFILMLVFPLIYFVLPFKMPQEYVGLKKVDSDGFILANEYCSVKCGEVKRVYKQGYSIEKKYYSWRYANLLGRTPFDSECCYYLPFNYKFLFGILLLFELTFEFFPAIILLSLTLSLLEYLKKGRLRLIERYFPLTDEVDIDKINVVGGTLILCVILYNLLYINQAGNF
ncbi:MAG: hypothetical protein HUU01_08535 [Saprospiraceae bacterium]|nr:hypothetical protein [Saprospiraceae bacterium]